MATEQGDKDAYHEPQQHDVERFELEALLRPFFFLCHTTTRGYTFRVIMAFECVFVSAKSTIGVVSLLSCIVAVFLLSATLLLNTEDRRDAGTMSVSHKQPFSSCKDLVQQLEQLQNPWEFNQFRRFVALEHPTCFDGLFPKLAQTFQSRIGLKKQYSLHIPKTAGTSLCDLAERSNFTVPSNNCHGVSLGPYWCCMDDERSGKGWAKPMSCDELQKSEYDFVGNERWLDHDDSLFCSNVAYSITIREPVSRAMSNMNHFLTHFVQRSDTETRTKRMNIIQSNYMTWSLVSGITKDPTMFLVGREHLPLARQVLSRFDYIINVGGDGFSDQCLGYILENMGMSEYSFPYSQQSQVENYTSFYHGQQYEMLNAVDKELYQYAQELIRVDCEFFRRIKKQ